MAEEVQSLFDAEDACGGNSADFETTKEDKDKLKRYVSEVRRAEGCERRWR